MEVLTSVVHPAEDAAVFTLVDYLPLKGEAAFLQYAARSDVLDLGHTHHGRHHFVKPRSTRASDDQAPTGRHSLQTKNLGVGSSNLYGRASLCDIPCESHGIHTANVPWKPGTCAATRRGAPRHRKADRSADLR